MAVVLQATANPGTASWADNQDFVAGAVDTDDTAAGASQATSVRTGDATGGNSGTITVQSGTSTVDSGDITVQSGVPAAAGTSGDVAIATASTTGAGTSGDITLTCGTTVAGTNGTIRALTRMTATDGVAAGTARVVGGLAYRSVVRSGNVGGATAETIFDENYTLPANTLKVGTTIRVRAMGVTPTTVGGDTCQIRLRIGGIGGTPISTSLATDVANGDVWIIDAIIQCRTAGTGGTLIGFATESLDDVAAAGVYTNSYAASAAVDTTAALQITCTAEWSTTNVNVANQDALIIDVY